MNLSAIFTAAHAAARKSSLPFTYAKRLSMALKKVWARAKELTAQAVVEAKELVVKVGFMGGNARASQLSTLLSLGATGWSLSVSQFEKRMNYFEMEEAIVAARAGVAVRFIA